MFGIIDLADFLAVQMDSKIKLGPPTAKVPLSSSSFFSSLVAGSELKITMGCSALHRYQTVATRCFALEFAL